MRNGFVEIGEDVILVREPIERADDFEDPEVLGARPFQQDGDAAAFEFGHDVAEGLRAGRVEYLQLWETQDHDANVGPWLIAATGCGW